MGDIKRILVVSRMSKYCRKAVHYGVSISQKYNAKLYVLHVTDPFIVDGTSLSILAMQEELKKHTKEAKEELDELIELEKKKGVSITKLIREGRPGKEIIKVIKEKNIDLVVMLAHPEARMEQWIFGRENEEIIRKMPCSILLVKE